MNEEKWLEQMSARAREESVPAMDVAPAVVARVHGSSPEHYDPMVIMAGTSAAAACIIFAYALHTWSSVQEPFSSMLASMNVVLQ